MENEILDTFIEALTQVFRETGIAIDSIGSDVDGVEDQVVTSIGVTGEVKGFFMLGTDNESALKILTAMMGDLRLPLAGDRGNPQNTAGALNEIQMAALGEMSNQISGRAITLLSRRHLDCDMTPPAVITALGMDYLVPVTHSFRKTVQGPFGRLHFFLWLQETTPHAARKKLVDNT